MRRASITLAALLLAPFASAQPWLQWHHDAASTAASTDPGPSAPEIGLVVELGELGFRRQVMADADAAYVLARDGLLRIDLSSAQLTTLIPLDHADTEFSTFASDGDAFYVILRDRLAAFSLEGEPRWEAPIPRVSLAPRDNECRPPLISEGIILMGCSQYNGSAYVPAPVIGGSDLSQLADRGEFFVAFSTLDGALHWVRPVTSSASIVSNNIDFAASVSVIGGQPVTLTTAISRGASSQLYEARERDTGDVLWSLTRNVTLPTAEEAPAAASGEASPREPASLSVFHPTGSSDELYLLLDGLTAVRPEDRAPLWTIDFPARATNPLFRTLRGDSLFISNGAALGLVDLTTHEYRELERLTGQATWGPISSGGRGVFVLTRAPGDSPTDRVPAFLGDVNFTETLRAVGFDGAPLWTMGVESQEFGWASGLAEVTLSGEALFIIDGNLLKAIGRVPASIAPVATVADPYPAVGTAARIDASATRAGAQGSVTRLRVDWGDGTLTDWSLTPEFEHAYADAGDRVATLYAQNDAGQTAQQAVTIHVGQARPVAPGIVDVALSDRYQNLTFFIVGLAVTAIGGVFGIVRPRRRRAKTRALLAAVDALHERTRADPLACEAALKAELRRTREALLGGSIDEDQANAVALHIQDLVGNARLRLVTSRYAELPPRALAALQATLADGVVTQLEKEHVVRALDAERALSDAERERLKALVEAWFRGDQA